MDRLNQKKKYMPEPAKKADEWYIVEINRNSRNRRAMKIFLNVLVTAGFALALIITTKTFVIPHQEYQDDPSLFLYDQGSSG